MKRQGGFLLVEVLIAVAILTTALFAALEALTAAGGAVRRNNRIDAIAACAEGRLAMTLLGTGAPEVPCAPGLRVEMDSALPLGDVEQVTWQISFENYLHENFTVVRRAR